MEISERREEDKKPGDHQAAYINLKVSDMEGNNDAVFRMKRSTKLKNLMYAYCALKSVDFSSIVFLSNVFRRIYEDQTPDQLEMEDGDEISTVNKSRFP